jgi:cellulose synthase operon protein C
MISTLRDWRRVLRRTCFGFALLLPPACAYARPEPLEAQNAPDAPQSQEVDAAAKQLMAANGLLQRGLFKLAEKAYADFLAANEHHPQATAARYALAVCQMRLGEHAQAIESLQPVIHDEKFEQRDEALAVLGYCELVSKHYEPAQAAFAELISKYPHSKQAESAACYQVQALYLSGNARQAAVAGNDFVRDYPKSEKRPTTMYFLALSHKALGEHEKVIATLAQLISEFPNSNYKTDALLLCGQSDEALGKLDAAIEQYRQMLAAAPEARKADAHYSLGVALYKAAQYDQSAHELEPVASDSSSPYAKPAKLQLGLAQLAANHIADARRTLERVAGDDAARVNDALYGLAQCDIADKNFDAAHRTLDDLSRKQPAPANLVQILMDRAVCLMELGKFQPAADEFQAFRDQHGQSPQISEAIYRQAFCLHKLAKYDRSHALCEQLAAMPKSAMTAAGAELDAENLFLLAKYADAQRAFATLADGAKDPAKRLRLTLRQGQCEYFAGDYTKAVEILQPITSDSRVANTEELQPAIFLCGDALLQQNKFAPAAEMLGRYLAVAKGDQREAQFKLARAQLGANQTDAAKRTLTELAQGPADSAWVQRGLLELGQLEYKSKEPDRAAAALSRVVQANAPGELCAPAIYLLGWIDFDAKKYGEAAERWKTLKEKFAKNSLTPDAEYQRGVALKEANQLDEALSALQDFASAHSDNPNAPKARQLAAAVLSSQGKSDQAAKILAELASSPQASDTVLYDLAWSQRNTKNLPAAKETYRKLQALHSDSRLAAAVRTELAELLYEDKNYAEAAELLEKVVGDSSADAKVLAPATYRLGFCYLKQSQWDKAAATFTQFADRFSDDPKLAASALLQSAIASAEQSKFDQAERSLSRMLGKYGQDEQAPIATLKLCEAQAEQQKFDDSLGTARQFLDRFAKNEFAYRARFAAGWALENLHKYEEAREAYKQTIGSTNGETAARAQFQIGETFLAEQKFEQAAAALLAVEDVYAYPKWSARALLEAGRAFEQLRQPDRAKQQYSLLLSKYKTAPEAEMAQERMKAL